MRAYSESLVSSASKHLASAYDYAVNDCGIDIKEFTDLFLQSGIADLFGEGNPAVIDGMSGPELARAILSYGYGNTEFPPKSPFGEPSPEFWVGWAIAQYQWHSARTFSQIFTAVSPLEIIHMYPVYHEMDIRQFCDEMDTRIASFKAPSHLQTIRSQRGMSQSQLAKASDVSIRSIQLYEQGINDIDRAQARTLYRLAHVLGCSMEDLLEDPTHE